MRKIKSIQQLQAEKKRLRLQQEKFEHDIIDSWEELKDGMRPRIFPAGLLTGIIRNKSVQGLAAGGMLKSALTYGVAMIAQNLAGKAGEKLGRLFSKRKKDSSKFVRWN